MKDNIREFVETWKSWSISRNATSFKWASRLKDAGYIGIPLNGRYMSEWPKVHEWCNTHIGESHYTWTGSTFWFENQKDANWFALRWS